MQIQEDQYNHIIKVLTGMQNSLSRKTFGRSRGWKRHIGTRANLTQKVAPLPLQSALNLKSSSCPSRDVKQELDTKVAELDDLQQWLQSLEGLSDSAFLLIMLGIKQAGGGWYVVSERHLFSVSVGKHKSF